MNSPYDPYRDAFRARLDSSARGARPAGIFGATGPLGKVLGVVVGIIAVAAAMAMSVIALGAILVVGVVGGAWFWWRARHLRRQLRAEMARMQAMSGGSMPSGSGSAPGQRAAAGDVIDGDFIREAPAPSSTTPREAGGSNLPERR